VVAVYIQKDALLLPNDEKNGVDNRVDSVEADVFANNSIQVAFLRCFLGILKRGMPE
jgi:hypothetical protein